LAYRTEVGHVRERNEDAFLVPHPDVQDNEPWVVAIADGLGGHPAGDEASAITVETLGRELSRHVGGLDNAVQAAHTAVTTAAVDPAKAGMGSTVIVALVDSNRAELAHVGDSRAYLIRDGSAIQITTDHSRSGYLTQAVGLGTISPEMIMVDLAPGDRLLLCTDGLFALMSDLVIEQLATQDELDGACDLLVDAALTAGGYDNVTVVLVEV
jgi:protein phosphatase